MSQDVSEQLKLLTPAAADRDALLFAAGQAAGAASVKPQRFWKWACGFFATSQIALVSLWFFMTATHSIETIKVPTPSNFVSNEPALQTESSSEMAVSTPPDPHSYIAIMKNDDFNRYPQPSQAPRPASETPHRILTPRWNGDLPQ